LRMATPSWPCHAPRCEIPCAGAHAMPLCVADIGAHRVTTPSRGVRKWTPDSRSHRGSGGVWLIKVEPNSQNRMSARCPSGHESANPRSVRADALHVTPAKATALQLLTSRTSHQLIN
jgi:hypothetical protein